MIGMQVRRVRLAAGVTAADLARHFGKSRGWLVQRELGSQSLKEKDATRLLEIILAIAEKRLLALRPEVRYDAS